MKNLGQRHFVVTGGNGYIGSHLCRYLFNLGHKISIIDNFSTSPKVITHTFGEFFEGEIDDCSLWKKIVSHAPVDGVFHFAAKALVGESEAHPWLYYQANLIKTVNLLQVMNAHGISKIVFSSTCATFGHPVSEFIDESHPQAPVNTYGKSKLWIEQILKDLALKKMMKSVVLRYFNAAGCSPDGVIGENHDPETHLIPNIILSYLTNFKQPLKIFGNQFATPDGTCIRDYIHVEDLIKAHWLAFEYMDKTDDYFSDFNLGTEVGTSNLEMIKTFEQILKTSIPFEFAPARAGDPAKLVARSSKAKNILQFKPEYSIKDCLEHSLNYFKNKRKDFFHE